MNFRILSIALVATWVGVVQIALALSPPEVSDIAKKITVRIEGNGSGTGVIVSRQGNTYVVLTNTHVLERRRNYSVQTFDGKTYLAVSRDTKRIPGVDLSLIQFSSEEDYAIAQIGNSDRLNEGMTLYIGGWAATDRVNRERGYRFSEGRLSGRATNPEQGYGLIYSNAVKPGMSGSPVLNEEGQLVGINGKAVNDIRTGGVDYYGIPINIYLELAKKSIPVDIGGGEVNASAGNPQTKTSPAPSPQSDSSARNLAATTTPANNRQVPADRPEPKYSLSATLTGHSRSVYSLAYSPDGNTLATASADKTVKIWSLAARRETYTLTGHQEAVRSIAYSPDGKTLASASADRTIKIWDLTTGKEIRTLKGHADSVNALAYSFDGQNLASGSSDRSVKVWDIATGQEIYSLTGHTDSVNSISYNLDGKTLASASADKTIKIWDLTTGKEIQSLTGHGQAINALAYSLDGKTLASGSSDKTIKIWDAATGAELRTLKGHRAAVDALTYSPDGKTLASGSEDKAIKLWDAATGAEIRTLNGFADSIYSLAYSPDGRALASSSSNVNSLDNLEFPGGIITIWQLSRW